MGAIMWLLSRAFRSLSARLSLLLFLLYSIPLVFHFLVRKCKDTKNTHANLVLDTKLTS
eukprot:SAG11_NODE_1376_length_5086_cov_19.924804_6_plen_59_part_00